MSQWLFVLSPLGGARQASQNLNDAFQNCLEPSRLITFDSRKYLNSFKALLKTPDETMAVDLLNQALIVQCLQYSITHLFVSALCPITLFTLNLLKKQNIITIHWFFEDYRRALYWKEIIGGYTWFLAIQKKPFTSLCKSHGSRYAYLPTAASTKQNIDSVSIDKETTSDIAFVGLPSRYRIEFFEYLLSQGFTMSIAGEGWSNYRGSLESSIVSGIWVDEVETANILKSAIIAVNISVNRPTEECDDTQISPRVFDILSTNQTLLTEDVPLIHETLGDCHFYTYRTKEEAVSQIKTILKKSHLNSLYSHLKKNRDIILQKHTWANRAIQIIELCN